MDKQDFVHTRIDLYLQEIEGIDDYWGPTFKAIYECDEYELFKEKLEERIKKHDKDIERLCNYYYQGFIDSVRELLQVRNEAKNLRDEVMKINTGVQTVAKSVLETSEELVKARQVEANIDIVMEQLKTCLPVINTYSKLQKQMQDKRYYPALKTLEQLEHIQLASVESYRFSGQIKENIPRLRENIKRASMMDLKDFLESIIKYSPKVGETAISHTSQQLANDPTIGQRRKKKSVPKIEDVTGDEEEDEVTAEEMIDYSPVYRCLHIYTVLGARAEFENYYRDQRLSQVRLILQPPPNMHESTENYRSYICAIVGFFITEDHVVNTTNGLITRTFLDDTWTMALQKIVNVLRTQTAYCTDAALMLKIKNVIMLFSTTMGYYGFNVKPLTNKLVLEMRDHYNEVLLQRWVHVFRDILERESFLPIQVFSMAELEQVINSFPFEVVDKVQLPYKLPFSYMVPRIYQQVKEFIYACLKFSDDLNLSQVEVVAMIRKSINLLLSRTFTGCLSSHFRKPELGLLQTIQIIIDTGYLEDSTVYLEEFVYNITGEDSAKTTHHTSNMFKVARDDAVKQICEKLNKKLSEFMELESYDWVLSESHGRASTFITDMIAFLQSTFQSFTHIPQQVAIHAMKSACQHIAHTMSEMLLSNDVKHVSMGALQQISLDVLQCEHYAATKPVSGLKEDDLLEYFKSLRQMFDLFTEWDWPSFFHDYGNANSKYDKVNINHALILLEKLNQADKKDMFSMLKKSERDKKKLLDTVMKQLKQLALVTNGN